MANAQKYTRAACGHLAAHYERRKDEKGEYVKFGNQDIDPQKTHLNYNLCPRRGLEQIDFIRQRTTEARTLKRDDVNVMCSWVVTLPEYRHHNQNLHVDLEAMVRRLGQIIREKLPEVYAAITQPKRDRQQPPQKQKPKSRDLER